MTTSLSRKFDEPSARKHGGWISEIEQLSSENANIEVCKLGCVVRMVVDSILPHAKSGPNDRPKDAPPFIYY